MDFEAFLPPVTTPPAQHRPFRAGGVTNQSASPRDREALLGTFKQDIDELRTIAWIWTDIDGGPIRTIINGRQRRPTGRNVLIKAGFRGQPWESMKGEEPIMRLCEVSTAVHSFLAQPHRLEIAVSGASKHLTYFPDARIVVDRGFAEALVRGIPFDKAVAQFRPQDAHEDLVTIIVEAKTQGDLRRHDPAYQAKLALAKEIYRGLGWYFVEVLDVRDLSDNAVREWVNDIYFSRHASIDLHDVDCALEIVRGSCPTYGRLIDALGGSKVGVAKAAALHVRRIIALNLSKRPARQTRVFAPHGGNGNFAGLA